MHIEKNIDKYFRMIPPRLSAVVICQAGDGNHVEEIVGVARKEGAVTNMDGEVFWVVLPDDPGRAWDLSLRLFRMELAKL